MLWVLKTTVSMRNFSQFYAQQKICLSNPAMNKYPYLRVSQGASMDQRNGLAGGITETLQQLRSIGISEMEEDFRQEVERLLAGQEYWLIHHLETGLINTGWQKTNVGVML